MYIYIEGEREQEASSAPGVFQIQHVPHEPDLTTPHYTAQC